MTGLQKSSSVAVKIGIVSVCASNSTETVRIKLTEQKRWVSVVEISTRWDIGEAVFSNGCICENERVRDSIRATIGTVYRYLAITFNIQEVVPQMVSE